MAGPLSYIGGKNRLAKRVIEIFPKHTTYVEAFAGGAQVFFHKDPSKVEVLNDLDGEIVNFYRVCQQHHEELIRYFRFVLVSRTWFDLLKAIDRQKPYYRGMPVRSSDKSGPLNESPQVPTCSTPPV
jgi:site-specific DNA-adenine methylase